jgi:hypothetical protein
MCLMNILYTKNAQLQFLTYLMTCSPVTVAERSKACTVFVRLEAGILVSNPTQGMDV